MKHIPVKSSNIESAALKGTVLHVKFKRGGTYEYLGVTTDQYQGLLKAESPGKYLNGLGLKGKPVKEEKS